MLAIKATQVTYFKQEPITTSQDVMELFTPFDLKRLESYSQKLLDYHVIIDLVPTIAKLYFLECFKEPEPLKLSSVQTAILLSLGLQKKNVERCEKDLGLAVSQILALFGKAIKKTSIFLNEIIEKQEAAILDTEMETAIKHSKGVKKLEDQKAWNPMDNTLQEELSEAGNEFSEKFKQEQRNMINSLNLEEYAIGGNEKEWESAKISTTSKIVNIKSDKKRKGKITSETLIQETSNEQNSEKKRKVKKR
jgi:N-acetyltransferase 10